MRHYERKNFDIVSKIGTLLFRVRERGFRILWHCKFDETFHDNVPKNSYNNLLCLNFERGTDSEKLVENVEE